MNAGQVSGLSPEEVLVLETGHVMSQVDWIAECGGTLWEVISMGQPVQRGREAITNPHRLLFVVLAYADLVQIVARFGAEAHVSVATDCVREALLR
jgi:hypothetical protein